MAKSSAAMPICFTPAAIRRRGIPSRARSWSSAIPRAPTPIRCSARPARSASASPARSPTRRLSWTGPPWSARRARSSRRPYASWSRSTSRQPEATLFRGLLQRRDPGKNHLDSRAAAGFGIEVEPAAETVGHDAVDDMQAEPGTALIAARGEERIERAAADVHAHAAAIVGKKNLDIFLARRPHLDVDRAGFAVGEGVRHGIEEQIGQHLSVGSGIAVHDEVGLAID